MLEPGSAKNKAGCPTCRAADMAERIMGVSRNSEATGLTHGTDVMEREQILSVSAPRSFTLRR